MKKYQLIFYIIAIMFAKTLQAQIPTNGLVAWYPFTGNAIDSSGNGNNGINYGATLTSDRFGKVNNAYFFNGSSSNAPYIESKNPVSSYVNGVSYCFWYKKDSVKRSDCLMTLGKTTSTFEFYSYSDSISLINFDRNTSNNVFIIQHKVVLDTNWHNFIITSINGKTLLFFDGIILDSNTTAPMYPNGGFLDIGKHDLFAISSNTSLHGKIDDIRIYSRTLNSSEVQALYHERGYGSTLPLEITNFSINNSSDKVAINWQTATELNTSHFIIQHSTNGTSFSEIGTLNAIGSGANSYSFTDNKPANGINYYRLQSVDKDGSSTYSKTVSVIFGDKQSFSIVPNPAKDFATIGFNKTVGNATLSVYDITGKAVITQTLSGGSNTYKLSIQSLKNGVYVVKVNTANDSYNEKLLINK